MSRPERDLTHRLFKIFKTAQSHKFATEAPTPKGKEKYTAAMRDCGRDEELAQVIAAEECEEFSYGSADEPLHLQTATIRRYVRYAWTVRLLNWDYGVLVNKALDYPEHSSGFRAHVVELAKSSMKKSGAGAEEIEQAVRKLVSRAGGRAAQLPLPKAVYQQLTNDKKKKGKKRGLNYSDFLWHLKVLDSGAGESVTLCSKQVVLYEGILETD